jgi:hypothetical protein
MFQDEKSVKFLHDDQVKEKLAHAKKLSSVDAKDYDAVFYVGGHGPVIDLAFDPVNAKLASDVTMSSSRSFLYAYKNRPSSSIVQANPLLLCATDLRESGTLSNSRLD